MNKVFGGCGRQRNMRMPAGGWMAAIFTLLLLFGGAASSQAQVERLPTWGVIPFADKTEGSDMAIGRDAAQAVADELAKINRIDVLPVSTTERQLNELGLTPDISRAMDISRLGQALEAIAIVSGEVLNYRITNAGGSKQAEVIGRVFVRDVASGIVINGAAVYGKSGMRSGNPSDQAVVEEAFKDAAFKAVRQIESRRLPRATVLNVLDKQVLIDKGRQDGLEDGMQVIVTRGAEQVATAEIVDIDADSAFIRTTRNLKGIRRGDKIQVMFDVPEILPTFSADGTPEVREARARRSGGGNSGLVTVLIVLVILGLLLFNGKSSSQNAVDNVTAEATIVNGSQPGVKVSWRRDSFFLGNSQSAGPFLFQVYRSDYEGNPVAVAPETSSSVVDDLNGSNGVGSTLNYSGITVIGGTECVNGNEVPTPFPLTTPLIVPGTAYTYSVDVIYTVNRLDLPGASSGGGTTGGTTTGGTGLTTGGTTGTNTTGGTTGLTTGGTTGTTGTNTTGTTGTNTTTGGAQLCYFKSGRSSSSGQATPLNRPDLRAPNNDQVVTTPIIFQFTSVRGPVLSTQIEYALQISTSPAFPSSQTITLDPFIDLTTAGGALISTPTTDTSTIFPTANELYWRVGARNPSDEPGPVRGSDGERFIYSAVRRFRRTAIPPQP